MKIVILDTIGIPYNGNTLTERGLGGSEAAVILITAELVKIGFDVTVYCNCTTPGVYNNVIYKDISTVNTHNDNIDVLISSRSIEPYISTHIYNIVNLASYKVLWLHDTFIEHDDILQNVLADNIFDEIFTLSDWHSTYISTAPHTTFRHPEFIKNKLFHTRNGVVNYINEVNIDDKDPNLFVYNSSLTKGMVPLLEEVWPLVIANIPTAKLVIIGGYYKFHDTSDNSFENQFLSYKDKYNNTNNITFTGIIKQTEIADILAKATYMLYPSIYPETFGISALEAVNYNVLLIGYNFGALEEVVPNNTSYQTEFHYNYHELSKELLLNNILKAYNDNYLKQQKQYACNEYKPYISWDIVALQWKHHIYYKLNKYLSITELRKHRHNIGMINKLFKKQMINNEEYFEDYSNYDKYNIVIISPFYNVVNYIEDCIHSVASQNYNNYTHYLIDDLSSDDSYNTASNTIEDLPDSIKNKFILIKNSTKKYAIGNQIETIYNKVKRDPSTIVILLDGDDTLVNDPDIFNYINRCYNTGIKFTYGSCRSVVDNIDLVAQPYPDNVITNKSYREHKFTWGIPYTHLRTFSLSIFLELDISKFKDVNGWYQAGSDVILFYELIEKCNNSEIKCIQKILVNYNDNNPLNDYKVNSLEQNRVASIGDII